MVPFYPSLSWILTYASSAWTANISFCTTSKIQTCFQGWLGLRWYSSHHSQTLSLPDYAVVTLANFQFLRSTQCFQASGLSFLFSFSQNTFFWLFKCGSPCGFRYYHHLPLQMMKSTPGRLNNLPKA